MHSNFIGLRCWLKKIPENFANYRNTDTLHNLQSAKENDFIHHDSINSLRNIRLLNLTLKKMRDHIRNKQFLCTLWMWWHIANVTAQCWDCWHIVNVTAQCWDCWHIVNVTAQCRDCWHIVNVTAQCRHLFGALTWVVPYVSTYFWDP